MTGQRDDTLEGLGLQLDPKPGTNRFLLTNTGTSTRVRVTVDTDPPDLVRDIDGPTAAFTAGRTIDFAIVGADTVSAREVVVDWEGDSGPAHIPVR